MVRKKQSDSASDSASAPGKQQSAANPEVAPANSLEIQPTSSSASGATTGALEAKVAELTSALQAAELTARQREQELLQKITHLQEQAQSQAATVEATLQQQQDNYAKLQAEVEQANQSKTKLEAELEAAKQVIFQLSQVNTKPPVTPTPVASQPPAKAKSTPPEVMRTKAQAAEPELEPSQSKLVLPPQPATRKLQTDRMQTKRYEVALHRILDHPTQPGSLPSMSSEPPAPVDKNKKLSDTDMGWVD